MTEGADLMDRRDKLKQRLAEQFPSDRGSYTAEKRAFVEKVLELAQG